MEGSTESFCIQKQAVSTSLKNVGWGHQIIGFIIIWYENHRLRVILTSPGLKSNKMSALEMNRNFEQNFSGKHIIKMNTKTVRELRSIAKDKGLCGYYKLKKANLVALLLE